MREWFRVWNRYGLSCNGCPPFRSSNMGRKLYNQGHLFSVRPRRPSTNLSFHLSVRSILRRDSFNVRPFFRSSNMGRKLYDRIIKCPSVHPSFRPSIIGMKLYDKVLLLSVCPSIFPSVFPTVGKLAASIQVNHEMKLYHQVYLWFFYCPWICSWSN